MEHRLMKKTQSYGEMTIFFMVEQAMVQLSSISLPEMVTMKYTLEIHGWDHTVMHTVETTNFTSLTMSPMFHTLQAQAMIESTQYHMTN